MDLNSVLIEGVIQSTSDARKNTGYWIGLESKSRDHKLGADTIDLFTINVRDVDHYPASSHQPGQRIRVLGKLQHSARKGLTILAFAVEKTVTTKALNP